METCQLANRTSVRAYRVEKGVLICAEGILPNPGYKVDIAQSPIRIFPPQFEIVMCPTGGMVPQVLTPYSYSEVVEYPGDQDQIRVAHSGGVDDVPIKNPYAGDGKAALKSPGADEAVGFSSTFSFDEAFRNALRALPDLPPPDHPDQMVTVRVQETGALFGGIAGFNDMYVRVSRTAD